MRATEDMVKEYVFSMAKSPSEFISERNIAQHFNLKRSAVREIFLSLEGEGFLERIPQVGYKFVDYQYSDKRTIYAIRYTVEREAARKAITNATREDILRMTLILEDMYDILNGEKGDTKAFEKADMEFHGALVKASHDNMLVKIFSFITTPIFTATTPLEKLGTTHDAHKRMLEALKKSDEEGLMQEMKNHLGNYEKIRN